MKNFVHLLLSVLLPAAVVGLLVGFVLGWHYLVAGFPLLLLGALRQGLLITLGGAVLFVMFHEPIRRLLVGRWPRLAMPLAAGLAAAPFVALAGYQFNRARAIRPSEIFESYALIPNLKLLAGCFVLYLLVVLFLRWRETEPPQSWQPAAWQPLIWPALVTVGLLAAVQLGVLGLYRDGDKKKPDVLVLLVDALRADHLSSYGYDRETSPAIDSLARDGVLFRQAIAQSTFTKTSIASLFTGLYPHGHGIYWGQRQLPDGGLVADLLGNSAVTLAEVMRDNGYLTAAWVQNSHLRRVMGFAQGFVDYHDQQGSIERIHDRFLPWHRGPGRRYNSFVYLHYIDLHDPYLPKPPYDTLYTAHASDDEGVDTGADVYEGVDFAQWGSHLRAIREGRVTLSGAQVERLRALYDGQLRAIDDQISLLLDELRASGRYDDTLIVLTADHGDAFMEHGFISHSTAPYEELVRVPLIVKLPKGLHAGREINDQVRLVDLMPTLLAATRSSKRRPENLDGCNLMPWIEQGSRPAEERPECGFAVTEIAEEDDAPPTLAVRTERYKYVYREKGEDELFDLIKDPGEHHNLASQLTEETEPLRKLALYLASQRNTEGVDRKKVGGQLRKELEAMGYVGN